MSRRHDYKLVFGTDVCLPMSKAERLIHGESMMDHAMCLTGVTLDVSCAVLIVHLLESSHPPGMTHDKNSGYDGMPLDSYMAI